MCGFVWDGELLHYSEFVLFCIVWFSQTTQKIDNIWSDTPPTGKLNSMSTPPPPKKTPGVLTLPEGEEDDWLHHEELENRVVWNEQFACGKVEEEERVERQTDGDVVDYGHIKVAASHTGTGRHSKSEWCLAERHWAKPFWKNDTDDDTKWHKASSCG